MMTFHTCDIMIMMMKKIWFHEINDSLSRSLSPFTHSVQLQSGLTRQVSQFSNCLLGFMQGPVKIVWIGRWGISCDFSAPLPRRCVCMYAGGSRRGTLPRWINGGRWLDRAMVTYISGALSNYLTWARLRRERGSSLLPGWYLRLCCVFTQLLRNAVRTALHKLPSLSQISAMPGAQHRGKLHWNANLVSSFFSMWMKSVWNAALFLCGIIGKQFPETLKQL